MEPGVFTEFDPATRAQILELAQYAVESAARRRRLLVPDDLKLESRLRQPGASFVTLKKCGDLRGCIGSLEAYRPLAEDVVSNAGAATLRDPRFPPVQPEELADIRVSVSVLAPPRYLPVESESELLSRLRPGLDGLIIQLGSHRATFLPSVWEQLPEPWDFLRHLKHKAGLADDTWSNDLRCSTYEVIYIE